MDTDIASFTIVRDAKIEPFLSYLLAKIGAKNVKWLFLYNILSSFNTNNRHVNVAKLVFNKILLFFYDKERRNRNFINLKPQTLNLKSQISNLKP